MHLYGAAFWIVIGGIILGVALGFVSMSGWWSVGWLCLLALAVAASGLRSESSSVGMGCAIGLLALGIGIARVNLSPTPVNTVLTTHLEQVVQLGGVVVGEPDIRERTILLTIEPDILVASSSVSVSTQGSARVLVSVRAPANVLYGDYVTANGVLALPEPFETGENRTFEYPQFLAARGIGYVMPMALVTKTGENKGNALWASLFSVKQWYIHGLGNALPEPHAALAGGITIGDKRALGDELMEDFQTTGVSHIVVLSGYNITVVSDAVLWVLQRAPVGIGSSTAFGIIIVFVMASGASAAAVRAGIMAGIVLVARVTRRPYAASRGLALAAVAMVIYEPRVLLYDPGLQLSLVATLGLLYIAPLGERILGWMPETIGLRNIVASTLGTQIAVLPLLIYHSGVVSLASLPVNLLILPVIPLAMFGSALAGTIGAVVPTAGIFLGLPAYMMISYVLTVVTYAARVPFAAVTLPDIPVAILIAVYGGLAVFVYWFSSGRVPQQNVIPPRSN